MPRSHSSHPNHPVQGKTIRPIPACLGESSAKGYRVDARWVSTSLKRRYRYLWAQAESQAANPDEAIAGHAAHPQDYLEKIFQIPFWLQPMNDRFTQRLLSDLVQGGTGSPTARSIVPPEAAEQGLPPTERVAESAGQGPTEEPAEIESQPPLEPAGVAEGESAEEPPEVEEATMNPEQLRLQPAEIAYMRGLSSVLGRSPRAVKRFVNVYRLLRAGLSEGDLEAFLGTADEPATYPIVQTLLAIVVGVPGVSEEVFRWLSARDLSEPLASALSEFPSHRSDLERPREILNRLGADKELTVGKLKEYIAEVGRYSFRVGRMVAGEEGSVGGAETG